jgi:hypothetical protein
MKGRALLTIVSVFLLALPLMWISSRLLLGNLHASVTREEGPELVPVISPYVARRLPTFERDCEKNADCDAPLVCVRQLMWKMACVASTCATDADCREGLSCHSIAVEDRVLRLCGASGEVAEGEFCTEWPRLREWACAPDLVCTQLKCRRPCKPQEPRSCPEGFDCHAADVKGSVCLPTCEGRSCPEGQRCVALSHGVSICARVHGTDCQLHPCPAGQVCGISTKETRGDVWMRCELACGEPEPACPQGFSCSVGRCKRQCNSDAPGSCGPMEMCAGFTESEPGVCIFDSGS